MLRTLDDVVSAARQLSPARIAVVAGHDPDALCAIDEASRIGLATGILIGDRNRILASAAGVGCRVSPEQVVDVPDDVAAARRAIAMVRGGEVDLIMKGKIATATLVHAVLDRETGLRGRRLLSQVVVFQVPGLDRLMLLSDAAINIAPTLDQKADICRNAIDVAHCLGVEVPNVAVLCALEFVNSGMPATIDAAALTQMNRRGQIDGAYLEGPLALDAVLSPDAAHKKRLESPVIGGADILIAPSIEAANIMYRSILYFAHGESAGVVVGAGVPIVLLSRAESPQTKLRSIAIAKLVAATGRSDGAAA
ncbi:MAG: bifunctional enoyl-CoA hydratase/phosphate acetyltransferase [Chloroflexi bacterium]|nr:bifunctional enoyl-CoA hydratase/phosphate acetyltransferase [Chloroflexota bacterium]